MKFNQQQEHADVQKIQDQLQEAIDRQSWSKEAIDMVMRAHDLMMKAHAGQKRKTAKKDGQDQVDMPYVIHPMRIALILLDELRSDSPVAVCAALLHDSVEDSDGTVTFRDVENETNAEVALMVAMLTKPVEPKTNGNSDDEASKLLTKQIKEAMLHDYHDRIAIAPTLTQLVKLSDRLDNIRDSVRLDKSPKHRKFQERYLIETRTIYLPIALVNADMYRLIDEQCHELEVLLS